MIFLGDLLDEGSTADKNEFAFAVSRFRKIFKAARNVKRIFIAGDNDIGGEGGEKVDATRKIWFSEAFDNEEAPPAKPKSDFVQFFEVGWVMRKFFDAKLIKLKTKIRIEKSSYFGTSIRKHRLK